MKRAIVTGGAGLIGGGIIHRLLKAGWDVASFDLNASPGANPSIICDVSDERSVAAAFNKLEWDTLDLLVTCAGQKGAHMGSVDTLSLAEWRGMIDSHLTGAFLMTRAAVPLIKGHGAIINIASTRAYMSEANTEAYAAAKGGLVALTHALAVSLGPNIRCNAIAPGWITAARDLSPEDHKQHPAGRVGRPGDIANAVLYLAEAEFITGETITIDGGMTRKMIYTE